MLLAFHFWLGFGFLSLGLAFGFWLLAVSLAFTFWLGFGLLTSGWAFGF